VTAETQRTQREEAEAEAAAAEEEEEEKSSTDYTDYRITQIEEEVETDTEAPNGKPMPALGQRLAVQRCCLPGGR
jgi:hypothetical protein